MTLPPLHRPAALPLAWLGGLCGAIVLLLGGVLPFPLAFAEPSGFFFCIVELQIFFVLLVWPFFVPSILKDAGRPPLLLAHAAALLLLGLPLVLVGANVASLGAAGLIRSQVQVLSLAVLAAGVACRFRDGRAWYLLGVFAASVVLPAWGFLDAHLGAKAPPFAVVLSPFWAAVSADAAPAWIQSALAGVAGLVLLSRKAPA